MVRSPTWVRRLVARLAVGALVFAQFALAAQACMMPAMARTAAFSSDAMPDGCGLASKNACLAQWTAGDQADKSTAFIDFPGAAPHAVLAPPIESAAPGGVAAPRGMDRQTEPSSSVRYCRYLK